jgi:hypothetical protein
MRARKILRLGIALPLLLAGCDTDTVAPASDATLTTLAPLSAELGQPVPDLTGVWLGRGQFGEFGFVAMNDLVVTEQHNRRFAGVMSTGGTSYDVSGTVSAANLVNVVGSTTDGTAEKGVIVTGPQRLVSFDGGAAALFGALQNVGHQDDEEEDLSGGFRSEQFLLRQFAFDAGGDAPPSVAGSWEGHFISAVDGQEKAVAGSFEPGINGAPTRFKGALADWTELEGSISADGSVVIVAGFGTTPGVVAVLEGEYIAGEPCDDEICVVDPARIVGSYQLIQARKAGGGQQEFLADAGTFSIIAILIGL